MKSLANTHDLNESEEDSCKKFVDRIIKTNREIFILYSLLDKSRVRELLKSANK